MTEILIALVIGIVLGCVDIFNYKAKTILNKISNLCLFIMIFCLAAKVGCDPKLIESLKILGVQSMALAAGVMAGSVFMVAIICKLLKRELSVMLKEDPKK